VKRHEAGALVPYREADRIDEGIGQSIAAGRCYDLTDRGVPFVLLEQALPLAPESGGIYPDISILSCPARSVAKRAAQWRQEYTEGC
jgi:hypothetical protein